VIASATRSVTVEITLEVSVGVNYFYEYDDDGCGSPESTGNSMTGRRGGKHTVVDYVSWNPSDMEKDEALAQLVTCINEELDSDSVREAITDELDEE